MLNVMYKKGGKRDERGREEKRGNKGARGTEEMLSLKCAFPPLLCMYLRLHYVGRGSLCPAKTSTKSTSVNPQRSTHSAGRCCSHIIQSDLQQIQRAESELYKVTIISCVSTASCLSHIISVPNDAL